MSLSFSPSLPLSAVTHVLLEGGALAEALGCWRWPSCQAPSPPGTHVKPSHWFVVGNMGRERRCRAAGTGACSYWPEQTAQQEAAAVASAGHGAGGPARRGLTPCAAPGRGPTVAVRGVGPPAKHRHPAPCPLPRAGSSRKGCTQTAPPDGQLLPQHGTGLCVIKSEANLSRKSYPGLPGALSLGVCIMSPGRGLLMVKISPVPRG